MKTNKSLAQKRQKFHKLLIQLGEEKYKSVIVEGTFPGIESTTELNEQQLVTLINDALKRLGKKRTGEYQPITRQNELVQAEIRRLRNKCLIVLGERGIKATPKDWSAINKELEAERYQWILPAETRNKGVINKRGLMAFNTPETLKKLFVQLCSIRDNEKKIHAKIIEIASKN